MSNVWAWTLVYANDAAGRTTYGSLSTLVNSIKQGQDVKVNQGPENGSLGYYAICDELYANPDNSVTCTKLRNISTRSISPGSEFGFQDDAYHFFLRWLTQKDKEI